jgi:hypothetical protein
MDPRVRMEKKRDESEYIGFTFIGRVQKDNKNLQWARHQWLMPVVLATQETEIRRIKVQGQLEQIVPETLSRKNPSQKRADGVGPPSTKK